MTEMIGRHIRSFEILDFVGKGGHGAVYRARDSKSNRIVALKVMLPEHEEDDTLIERFRREAQIIRELRHPHIVGLVDYWQDDEGVWVVMDWLGGGDLRDYIDEYGAMPPKDLVPLLKQVASALHAAHAADIIHRDLKPDNIVLDEDGKAYLTDFGIAKRKGYTALTSVGMVMGSPSYLSPEQIMGEEISPRTDIYALGFTIYELLTGEHPFADIKNQIQFMMALVQKDVPLLENLPEAIAADLNALIQRATHKQADQRYPTAAALARHYAEIVGVD